MPFDSQASFRKCRRCRKIIETDSDGIFIDVPDLKGWYHNKCGNYLLKLLAAFRNL